MLVRDIYWKPDNGSQSVWQLYEGESVKNNHLYSCGEAYVQAILEDEGWSFRYRPYQSGLKMPWFLTETFQGPEEVLKFFVAWVVDNRREILAEMESYEA